MMKRLDVISNMKSSGIESLAHITMNGFHQYYVTIAWLEQMKGDPDIRVLSMEVKHLSTEDVMGRAPKNNNKKRLYNVR